MKLTESKLRKFIREIINEDFAGPLSKSQQKKFESNRKKNSEVLGYKLTGTTDRKTEIDGTNIKLDAPVTASNDIKITDGMRLKWEHDDTFLQ